MRTYIDRIPYQGIAGWPGDTSFDHQENAWETVRVGAVTMSLHTGTHIDAPRHLVNNSGSVDGIPDSTLCGPATVIDARGKDALSADLFEGISTPRILVRTDTWLDSTVFPLSFPLLTQAAARRPDLLLRGRPLDPPRAGRPGGARGGPPPLLSRSPRQAIPSSSSIIASSTSA